MTTPFLLRATGAAASSPSVQLHRPAIPTIWLRYRLRDPIAQFVEQMRVAFDHHGDLVRVKGLPFRLYALRDPSLVESLFRHPQVAGTKNPALLSRLAWAMPRSSVVLAGGDPWRNRRRQLQQGFKADWLTRYAQLVPPLTRQMLDRWATLIAPTATTPHLPATVELRSEFQQLITRLAFQMYFSCDLPPEKLRPIAEMIHFVEFHFVRLTPLWVPIPRNLTFGRYVRALQQLMRQLIAQRRRSGRMPGDLLDLLLSFKEKGGPWPTHQIVAEMLNLLFATCLLGTTLSWSCYRLATEPTWQRRLAEEVRQKMGSRPAAPEDVARLPQMERFWEEVLRMYPSSWVLPRYCKQGMELDGYRIPPRSTLFPMLYLIHRHPQHWDAPETFNPDRFLPPAKAARHPSAYLPYSKGERTCLGKHLAPRILSLVTATLLQRYELQYTSPPPQADFGFEIHPRTPMHVTLTPLPC